MSTALYTPLAGRTGTAMGYPTGVVTGSVNGAYGYEEALAAYLMKLVVEQTLISTAIDIDAPFERKATTALFTPLTGMQGAGSGIAATATGIVGGLYSYTAAEAAYGMKLLVEQTFTDVDVSPVIRNYNVTTDTTIPLIVGADADATGRVITAVPDLAVRVEADANATGRVTTAVTSPILVDTDATATGRVTTAVTNAPLIVGTDATATGRVTTAVPDASLVVDWATTGSPRGRAAVGTVPLKISASSTARGRVTAAVQAVIRWGVAATATGRIRAAVQAVLRILMGAKARQYWQRRGRVTDQSRHAMGIDDQSGAAMRIRDQSEGRPW